MRYWIDRIFDFVEAYLAPTLLALAVLVGLAQNVPAVRMWYAWIVDLVRA